MNSKLSTLVWPAITGILAALLIVQFFPGLLGDKPARVEVIQRTAERVTPEPNYSYADAVARAAPSVVSIYTRTQSSEANQPKRTSLINLGSGVIVSPEGYVITNNHVVAAADSILVALRDGREDQAQLIGTDPESDLAVLKVQLDALPSLPLTSSANLRVGDVVLAIGNPFGVGQTVTQGIISGLDRNTLGLNTYEDFIQTDAAINPGNSGGALITAQGDLAGINTAIFSKSGGSQGIGFAIPADQVQQVMSDIIHHGRVIRGWVGVEAHGLTSEEASQAGLPAEKRGLMISGIYSGSPAQRAGLLPGDIMLSINDSPVYGSGLEAMNYIARVKPGEVVKFTVFRQGEAKTFTIQISERPRSR